MQTQKLQHTFLITTLQKLQHAFLIINYVTWHNLYMGLAKLIDFFKHDIQKSSPFLHKDYYSYFV
jgi:hypothetical protein